MTDSPAPRSLGGAVRRGVAWSTASFAITKALAAVSLLVLARLLTPNEFGVVAAMTVLTAVIEVFADLGMRAAVIYEQGEGHDRRVDVAFTINLALFTTLTVVAFLAAPVMASFFRASGYVGLFRLVSLDIIFTGLGQIHDGLLLRDLRFNRRIVALVVNAVVQASVSIILAFLGFGAAALVWGVITGTAASTVALWLITGYRPHLRFDRAIAATMLPYGIAASALSFISQITGQVDPIAVGRILGERALGL
jgi:lipopolysaccharide exporter